MLIAKAGIAHAAATPVDVDRHIAAAREAAGTETVANECAQAALATLP